MIRNLLKNIKTSEEIKEKYEDIFPEENNNLQEKSDKNAPEGLTNVASEDSTLSQPPGKPPRPSLKKAEKNRASNDFETNLLGLAKPSTELPSEEQEEQLETVPPVKKRTKQDIKPKPDLPKFDKPKVKATDENSENLDDIEMDESEEEIKTVNKVDFMKDLNNRLQIKPPPLLMQNHSKKDEFDENNESSAIEDDHKFIVHHNHISMPDLKDIQEIEAINIDMMRNVVDENMQNIKIPALSDTTIETDDNNDIIENTMIDYGYEDNTIGTEHPETSNTLPKNTKVFDS